MITIYFDGARSWVGRKESLRTMDLAEHIRRREVSDPVITVEGPSGGLVFEGRKEAFAAWLSR